MGGSDDSGCAGYLLTWTPLQAVFFFFPSSVDGRGWGGLQMTKWKRGFVYQHHRRASAADRCGLGTAGVIPMRQDLALVLRTMAQGATTTDE